MDKFQCPATDVFSLGQIFNKVNRIVNHSSEVRSLGKQSLVYYSHERTSVAEVISNVILL